MKPFGVELKKPTIKGVITAVIFSALISILSYFVLGEDLNKYSFVIFIGLLNGMIVSELGISLEEHGLKVLTFHLAPIVIVMTALILILKYQ